MGPEPNPDRLRLVAEPGSDDARALSAEEGERQAHDDLVELERLADDSDYEFEDEEEPETRRGFWPIGLASVAVLGFVAVSWFAYQGVVNVDTNEAIPLVQADASPIKTRPTAPGGLEIPHQDKLVLNEITPDPQKPQVERLLPPPEVPKPPVAAAPAQSPVTQEVASQEQNTTLPLTTAAGPEAAPAVAPAAPAAPADTQTSAAPPKVDVPVLAPKPAPEAVAAAPKPAPKAAASAPVLAPTSAPKAPAPTKTQTAALTEGYLVQLASLKDKNLIGGEWVRLQKGFPTLLGDKKLVLQSADLGSKGVYHRLRVGYFKDKASAAATCKAFKSRNQACIVVRP